MCVCHPTQRKKHTALRQFPMVRDYFFIDQNEYYCSLIVLATDINKDVRLEEQTYD